MDLLIIALVIFMTIDLTVNHWSIAFHKSKEYRAWALWCYCENQPCQRKSAKSIDHVINATIWRMMVHPSESPILTLLCKRIVLPHPMLTIMHPWKTPLLCWSTLGGKCHQHLALSDKPRWELQSQLRHLVSLIRKYSSIRSLVTPYTSMRIAVKHI
jgi:hypothetical protein